MGYEFCKQCGGDGRVCPKCLAAWGSTTNKRVLGQLKNKHRRKYGGCGVKRGESIPCPHHTESAIVCDIGRERALLTGRGELPAGWAHEHLVGTHRGTYQYICPECVSRLRVGADYALETAGQGTLTESIACAFAFQLGQMLGGRSVLWQMMRPEFVAGERWWEGQGHADHAVLAPMPPPSDLGVGRSPMDIWAVHAIRADGSTLCGFDLNQPLADFQNESHRLAGFQRSVPAARSAEATCFQCNQRAA